MTPPIPPTGADGAGKAQSSGRGARIYTVVDYSDAGFSCFRPVADDRHLCFRARGHQGGCLPLPARWAALDITPANPRYVGKALS